MPQYEHRKDWYVLEDNRWQCFIDLECKSADNCPIFIIVSDWVGTLHQKNNHEIILLRKSDSSSR